MSFDLIDYDPWTGVRTLFDYDEMTDQMTIRREQSGKVIGAILDRNKAVASVRQRGKKGELDMRWVASVPIIVQEKWFRDHGAAVWKANEDWGHMEKCIALLNSSDWQHLKTIPGKI